MNGAPSRHDVGASEDLLVRSIALHIARAATQLWKRRVRANDILVRRYLYARTDPSEQLTHDVIVVLAPREISAAVVAQCRAFGFEPVTTAIRDDR